MKLGLINSAWAQAGRETAYGLEMTGQIGFDAVDIFADPLDLEIRERKLIRDTTQRLGLPIVSICCVATGLIDLNPSVRRFHADRVRQYLDLVYEYEARNLLLVLGEYIWQREVIPPAEQWRWAVDHTRELGQYAASLGLEIALELEPFTLSLLNDVPSMSRFLDDVNHPAVKANVDISHLVLAGQGPDSIEALKGRIAHIHISDCDGKVHGDLPPGRGVVPFGPYLEALKRVGDDDLCVSVELEYSPEPDRIVEWVREAYDQTARLMAEAGLRETFREPPGSRVMKRPDLLGLMILLAIVGLYGWPVLAIVRAAVAPADAFSATGGGLFDAAISGELGRPLSLALRTSQVVLAAMIVALPLGVALALLLSRTDLPGRRLVALMLAIVVFVPLPLHAAAWLGSFGNLGREQFLGLPTLLRGWPGAGFVHGMAALPWVVLIVSLGLLGVNPALEESALMETSARGVLWRVSLPAAVGHVAAAALAVAVLTAGEMTVTDLLQVRTYAEEAYLQAQLGNGPAAAAAVGLPPLVVLGGMIVLGMRAMRRRGVSVRAGRGRLARYSLGGWRIPLGLAVVVGVGGLLGMPVAGMVWRAGRVAGEAGQMQGPSWSFEGLQGTLWRAWPDLVEPSALAFVPSQARVERAAAWVLGSPLLATTLYAAMGASLALAIGLGLSWKARAAGFWSWLLAIVTALALATPGPIVGLGLKLAYLQVTWIHNTPVIVVLGYVARVLPFVLLALWPALLALPRVQVESAQLEGYEGFRLLGRVGYPACRRSLRAAWGLAFVLAIGELAATNLVQPPGVRTLTFQVWSLLHYGSESHLSGVGLILLVVYGGLGLVAAGLLSVAHRDR